MEGCFAHTTISNVSNQVIGCAIEVHRILGAGLLESVYTECLHSELRVHGLFAERERRVPITYKGQRLGEMLKIDLLVEKCVVVEVKAVEKLAPSSPRSSRSLRGETTEE